jgi:proteic killer suppression protein
VIKSFADKRTLAIRLGQCPRRVSGDLYEATRDKLRLIEAVNTVDDLRTPPSNRLEKLSGDRLGQWSIRVNRQWRLCFEWRDGAAWNVELVDYH